MCVWSFVLERVLPVAVQIRSADPNSKRPILPTVLTGLRALRSTAQHSNRGRPYVMPGFRSTAGATSGLLFYTILHISHSVSFFAAKHLCNCQIADHLLLTQPTYETKAHLTLPQACIAHTLCVSRGRQRRPRSRTHHLLRRRQRLTDCLVVATLVSQTSGELKN